MRLHPLEAGIWSCDLRANKRPRKKLHEKGQTHSPTDGHCDSMKDSLKILYFNNFSALRNSCILQSDQLALAYNAKMAPNRIR